MTISLHHSLKLLDQKKLYDSLCIQLFSHVWVLSYLIKYALLDYNHLSVKEIQDSLSNRQEYPFYQHQIHMENTVDKQIEEGDRYFDILFSTTLKNKQGKQEKVYINVEIQNDYYPGYSLITRGEYYISRMISRQYLREFEEEDFNSIKKVYSIWLCNKPAKKDSNTITRYPTIEKHIVGSRKAKKQEYDKSEVVLICLSSTEEKSSNLLLNLVNTIINQSISYEEKINKLEKITGSKIQQEIKEGVKDMCNLSEGIWRDGMKSGIQEGVLLSLQSLIKNTNMNMEAAMDAIGIKEEDKDMYRNLMLQ